MHLRQLGAYQCVVERVVFLLRHRAVQVVRALFVAGCAEDLRHVQRFGGYDGRGGVEEMQRVKARKAGNRVCQRRVGERPRGDNRGLVRDGVHAFAVNRNQRMRRNRLRHGLGKAVAIDRQRAARGHARFFGGGQDQAVQQLHFGLQKAGGVRQVLRLQRIRAHQLGKAVHMVGGGVAQRLHLIQRHGNAAACQLPRGLAAREACADYGNLSIHCPHPCPCFQSVCACRTQRPRTRASARPYARA